MAKKKRKRALRLHDSHYMDGFGDFGESLGATIAGPLIGGGIAQVGTLATKMLGRGKPIEKWGAAVGFGLGAAVSGFLAWRPNTRSIGIAGLATAALVALPRLAEDLFGPKAGATAGAFGIHTAEADLGLGVDASDAVQLLDAGAGGLGVITAEAEMAGALGAMPDPVQLLGARPEAELFGHGAGGGAGFGANFLSHQ